MSSSEEKFFFGFEPLRIRLQIVLSRRKKKESFFVKILQLRAPMTVVVLMKACIPEEQFLIREAEEGVENHKLNSTVNLRRWVLKNQH